MQPAETLPSGAGVEPAPIGSLRAGAGSVIRFARAEWGLLAAGCYAVIVSVCLAVYGGQP